MTVKIWDAAVGSPLKTFEGHSDSVNTVAFSPDGKLVASGSSDMTVKIWDAAVGSPLETFEGHSDSVNTVAFSPDGKLVASGSSDMTVKIWDAAVGSPLETFKGHSNSVNTVAFSPDGKLVASGSSDMTVRIWDATTGATEATLMADAVFRTLAFSNNDSYLYTDKGLYDINPQSAGAISPQLSSHMFVKGQWVHQGTKNFLWLPHEFRPTSVAVCDSNLALGHDSGHVTFIEFDLANTREPE